MIMDENMFNQFLLDPVLLDTSISLRDILWANPNTIHMVDQMRMAMVQMMMPELASDYSADKAIDIRFSLSHDLIKDFLPEARLTGLNIDKNGNIRLTLNMYAQLLIDKT